MVGSSVSIVLMRINKRSIQATYRTHCYNVVMLQIYDEFCDDSISLSDVSRCQIASILRLPAHMPSKDLSMLSIKCDLCVSNRTLLLKKLNIWKWLSVDAISLFLCNIDGFNHIFAICFAIYTTKTTDYHHE